LVGNDKSAADGEGQQQRLQHVFQFDQQIQSTSFIKTLLESSPDAIFMKDCAGRYLLVNATAARVLQLPADAIIGRRDDELFPADVAKRFMEDDQRVLAAGESVTIEEEVPVDDQTHTFLTTKTPCFDSNGAVIGIVGIARDITARKAAENGLRLAQEQLEQQAEEKHRELQTAKRILGEDVMRLDRLTKQLKASEERFRGIAEALPVPIAIARISDGVFLYANERLAHDFGATSDEIVGQSCIDFYEYPSDWDRLLQLLDHDGLVRDYELRARKRDGSMVWVAVSLQRTLFDGEDAVLAGFLDVTARRNAQESLEREHRMLQRSLNLHVRDRQMLAYEIHDGMVQDLTAAVMYLQSVQSQRRSGAKLPESLAKATELVQGSIDEARRLMNGLRPPVLEEHGIVMAVENLIDEIQATTGLSASFTHDVYFERIAPALEMAIYRIVQEGLNNVWKHSKLLKAEVEIRQEGDQIHVVVKDDGEGFDIKEVKSRSYGLRGIRERAKLLGGRAQITSSPGNGTAIAVNLPLAESIPPADDSWGG